jgi:UDP-glucose 4-epimerase
MRYLITGGAGFIGSHLSEELLRRDHEVYVLDDLSTGSIHNIAHLKENPRFHYVIDSVTNTAVTAELIDTCDVVYHLAAAVGVKLIVESPVRTIETNIRGTEIVLQLANKKKKPVFVASTSEVYGKSLEFPFREDGDLVMGATNKGRWSYACSKAIDEFLAIAYWREKRLPTVVVRLFNTVGPRQTGQYGMVVPTFVKQALAGKPITVYGDGLQSRCFTHVYDVVRALADLMTKEAAYGQVYNVGNDHEISILDLARKVISMTGGKSDIVHIPYEQAYEVGFEDMQRRIPSVDKVSALLGWRPTLTLDQILKDVIDYHQGESLAHARARLREGFSDADSRFRHLVRRRRCGRPRLRPPRARGRSQAGDGREAPRRSMAPQAHRPHGRRRNLHRVHGIVRPHA